MTPQRICLRMIVILALRGCLEALAECVNLSGTLSRPSALLGYDRGIGEDAGVLEVGGICEADDKAALTIRLRLPRDSFIRRRLQ
jgi:hypothetical protein